MKWGNVKRISVYLLLTAIAVLLSIGGVVLHCNWADGIAFALSEFFMGDTAYAPDYSECAYIKIKEGDPVGEIRTKLGDPLGIKRFEGLDYYNYSTWAISELDGNGGPACNYSLRMVVVSNDTVIGKWHEYYFD